METRGRSLHVEGDYSGEHDRDGVGAGEISGRREGERQTGGPEEGREVGRARKRLREVRGGIGRVRIHVEVLVWTEDFLTEGNEGNEGEVAERFRERFPPSFPSVKNLLLLLPLQLAKIKTQRPRILPARHVRLS